MQNLMTLKQLKGKAEQFPVFLKMSDFQTSNFSSVFTQSLLILIKNLKIMVQYQTKHFISHQTEVPVAIVII